jgi:ribosomal protein S27AE
VVEKVKWCPKCGAGCERNEVDIGVGVQYGPWSCPDCGWSEETENPLIGEEPCISF